MILFPIGIIFGPVGCPLLVVVGVGHIHAVLHPFVVFPAVELIPLALGPSIRAHSGLLNIFEYPRRRNGKVARIRGISLGCDTGMVAEALLVFGTFLFQGCCQSNQNLFVIGTLLVSLTSIFVVGVQVNHVGNEGTGVDSGGIFHSRAALALDVCKEISGCISIARLK